MDKKDIYREFSLYADNLPIFLRAWWIESLVTPEAWDVALLVENGDVFAAMPFVRKRRYRWVSELTQPPLTQYLGIWTKEQKGKLATKIGKRNVWINRLLEQLPRHDRIRIGLSPKESFWLPFYWNGFSQSTNYTYSIKGIKDVQSVWENISSSYRNKIKKAKKLVYVDFDVEPDEFYRLFSMTFERQSLTPPLTKAQFVRHHTEIKKHDAGTIFSAKDDEGHIHSVLYLTYDRDRAYVHLVGEDPQLRKSGAGILLIWEAIYYAANELDLNIFDFEGSMLQNVEKVRRDFGASPEGYSVIWRNTTIKGLLTSGAFTARTFLLKYKAGLS